MTLKRREMLLGTAAVATASASIRPMAATRERQQSEKHTTPLLHSSGKTATSPPMNMSRALQIMAEDDLDALVLGQGINFYHASGQHPITNRTGHQPGSFAIVTRSEEEPLALVLPSFTYYFLLADALDTQTYPIYLYTGPDSADPEEALPVRVLPDRKEQPMDAIERRRTSLTYLADQERSAAPGLVAALTKALTERGVAKGKIALDFDALGPMLSEKLPGASFVGASNALSRIRPIKSPLEIDLMRQAATMNAEAALAAVRSVRAGATYRDLRNVFAAEAARRGNRSVFMVVDRVTSEHFDAPFRDGQSFLIDAVSEYQGYHGDYGRTVFIGEPTKSMATATTAMGRAWDEVRHALKPGMRFSEVTALGQETLRKLGASYAVRFTPHSVGLYHTDNVDQAGLGSGWKDLILEPGMVISVDCPLLEAGVGGSAHLEDLTLITASGSEPINNVGDQVIIV